MEVTEEALHAARQIEQAMNLDSLLRKLQELPSEIRRQKDIEEACRQAVEHCRMELGNIEALIQIEVAEEKDPRTNKAAFPNADARKAELERRKSASEEYQAAYKALQEAENTHRSARFDLERLLDEFSAAKVAAGVNRARLEALVS